MQEETAKRIVVVVLIMWDYIDWIRRTRAIYNVSYKFLKFEYELALTIRGPSTLFILVDQHQLCRFPIWTRAMLNVRASDRLENISFTSLQEGRQSFLLFEGGNLFRKSLNHLSGTTQGLRIHTHKILVMESYQFQVVLFCVLCFRTNLETVASIW